MDLAASYGKDREYETSWPPNSRFVSMTGSDHAPIRKVIGRQMLRLLVQPMTLLIMARLQHGPATSTTLACALGESTDAVTQHLQQLAKHGMLEEISELTRGSGRWWRSARVDLRLPPRKERTPEMKALIDEMNRLYFAADLEDFARSQLEQRDEEWAGQIPCSRGVIHITSDELAEFFEEYVQLLHRYMRPEQESPPGARAVLTRFVAFPAPTSPARRDSGQASADARLAYQGNGRRPG